MRGSEEKARASRWGAVAAAAVTAAFLVTVGAAGATYRGVAAGEAAALLEQNRGNGAFVVLDLRTPKEFAEGRIEGARLIDFLAPSFRDEVARLDRDKTYLVYCRSGNRSGKALAVFEELGFRDVIHLSTGVLGWKDAGLPLTDGAT